MACSSPNFLPFELMALVLSFMGENVFEIAVNMLFDDVTGPMSESLINYIQNKYPNKSWFFFMNSYNMSYDDFFNFKILHFKPDGTVEAFYHFNMYIYNFNSHLRFRTPDGTLYEITNDSFQYVEPMYKKIKFDSYKQSSLPFKSDIADVFNHTKYTGLTIEWLIDNYIMLLDEKVYFSECNENVKDLNSYQSPDDFTVFDNATSVRVL